MEITNISSNGQSAPVNSKNEARSRLISLPPSKLELEDLYCMLQANPNDSVSAFELARRMRGLNRNTEALRILENVVKIDSRFETVLALGLVEYKMEMENEAFHHLNQALLIASDEEPELFEIFKILGNIFVRRGDFDSAEDSYNKAYRIQPESDVLLVNLGTLCIQRSNWDEAVLRFRSALQINNTNDKAWVCLAIGHRMKGDLELAWGNLEAAVEYNPLNEVALTLALDWGLSGGKESRVHELLRGFLVEGGWNERFSLVFSWLCSRRGEGHLAKLEVERLLAVNPKNDQAIQLAHDLRIAQ